MWKKTFDSDIDDRWNKGMVGLNIRSPEEGSELVVAHLRKPSTQDTEAGRLCSLRSEFQVSLGYSVSFLIKRWGKNRL